MIHTRGPVFFVTRSLLVLIPLAFAHGHGSHSTEAQDEGAPKAFNVLLPSNSTNMRASHMASQSYFTWPGFGGLMLAHIVLMTVAWFFCLPIGVMLSIARSPLALVAQLSFLGLHCVGLLLGTIYTSNAPNLYENSIHDKIGWAITWVILAQCVIGFVRLAVSLGKTPEEREIEQTAPIPIPAEEPAHQQPAPSITYAEPHRYSHDSGHYTASQSSRNSSISSTHEEEQQQKISEYQAKFPDAEDDISEKQGLLGNAKVQRVASGIAGKLSKRTMEILDFIYTAIDCASLPLGFVAFLSGAVVYAGIFRGNNIYNGLAHSVKGGIFIWYGLLTLGRWMGCFAEFGWAWNVRPQSELSGTRKVAMPSAEFVESFVIFLYGASNVWLEHLAAWGSAWSPQDFEHVSISIMFFGGGLCGMLVESRWIRDLLNTSSLSSYSSPHGSQSAKESWEPPKSYGFSMNPIPALVILLLGLMMGSHHQSSMVSTMVHKQWGTLFVGFALARAVTYILTYLSPPTSYFPSRPPSELISSFCLISGGMLFIISNKDTVGAMEHYGLHAMFPFTVTMGFTAFLMSWVIIVFAVKGWAVRRTKVANYISTSGA